MGLFSNIRNTVSKAVSNVKTATSKVVSSVSSKLRKSTPTVKSTPTKTYTPSKTTSLRMSTANPKQKVYSVSTANPQSKTTSSSSSKSSSLRSSSSSSSKSNKQKSFELQQKVKNQSSSLRTSSKKTPTVEELFIIPPTVKEVMANFSDELKQEIKDSSTIETQSKYQKIDTSLRGILPGGVTLAQAQNVMDKQKIEDLKERIPVIQELEDLQAQKDIVSKKGLENLGLFRSEEEKTYQDAVQREQFFTLQIEQIPQTAQAYENYEQAKLNNPNFDNAVGVPLQDSTDWKKILSYGGLAIAGLIGISILAKKK